LRLLLCSLLLLLVKADMSAFQPDLVLLFFLGRNVV